MSNRRFAEVFIYNSEDLANLAKLHNQAERAERAFDQAQKAGNFRGGDGLSPQAAKDAYDAAVADASTRAQVVRLEALGRKQWRALLAEHPPRRVTRLVDGANTEVIHDDDVELGVNTDTLPEVLLTYTDPNRPDMKTVVAPAFPTAASLLEWLDDLSGGDFDKLFLTAYYLNGELGVDPKATTYSAASPVSAATSG
jgi:hypothetical protein